MTKQDLFDWCLNHGCIIRPIPNSTIGSVWITHQQNSTQTVTDTKEMDKPVSENYVCMICTRLVIEIPNFGKVAQELIRKLNR